jgi:BirA family biotin operon repressor/biotin-[acetyl-CoA-carboxylase] ligase
MGGSLAPEAVVPRLRGRFGRPYVYVPRCPSTQRLLEEDVPEGAVAAADEQTEGRGRLGRRWLAPAGTSVLCSICVRPPVEARVLPELTVVGAEACRQALEATAGVRTALKLPNDVLVDGRKVAGILGEAHDRRVVLGIGVNVSQRADQLPGRAPTPPTSLQLETGVDLDRAELLAVLLERLESGYDEWVRARRQSTG